MATRRTGWLSRSCVDRCGDLATGVTTVAVATGIVAPGRRFDPFEDKVSPLPAGSAAGPINPADIASAAGVPGTEAARRPPAAVGPGPGVLADAISSLRPKASGAAMPGDRFDFVSNRSDGLILARTPAQALDIAHAGGAAQGFGVFPNEVTASPPEALRRLRSAGFGLTGAARPAFRPQRRHGTA